MHLRDPFGLIQAESLGELQLSLGKIAPPRVSIDLLICDSSSGKDGGGGGGDEDCSDSLSDCSDDMMKSCSSSGLWILLGNGSSFEMESGRRNGPESSKR